MYDIDREHRLHKIVAVSGFLFALSILPIAQYLLVHNQVGSSSDTGTVAGVSTDSSIIAADAPQQTQSTSQCEASKTEQLTDLTTWTAGKEKALLNTYNQTAQPYIAAKAELTGEDVTTESAALDKLIDSEAYQPYLTQLNQVKAAVATQEAQVNAITCN